MAEISNTDFFVAVNFLAPHVICGQLHVKPRAGRSLGLPISYSTLLFLPSSTREWGRASGFLRAHGEKSCSPCCPWAEESSCPCSSSLLQVVAGWAVFDSCWFWSGSGFWSRYCQRQAAITLLGVPFSSPGCSNSICQSPQCWWGSNCGCPVLTEKLSWGQRSRSVDVWLESAPL